MYESIPEDSYHSSQDDRDSIIVVVHWIGTLITSCFYPQSRILGLEMLYRMAVESLIDIRLQFILPYVLQMFDDENSKVKAKAIEVAVMMFADVLDKAQLTTLTATDYKVFDNYILPAFLKVKNESKRDQYVQHVFVRYLPLLAQIGHRFLELSIGSRFQKRQNAKNNPGISSHQSGIQHVLGEESKDSDNSSSVATGAQDSDDESDRLFSQSENLLSSTVHLSHQHRQTVVIKDSHQQHERQREKHHHDAHEVFVNYDTEYDKLRRIILGLINDILSESEPSLQRMVYDNLGALSVFFGRKMTIDNLIPLSNSCFNKKDFMLRMECLRGIPYLGLRVGQQTLAKYLLVTCTHLLYDSEELVVNEMITALCKLLEFGLLSKADSLENLEKLMPYLLYPNTWIREAVMKYIKFLADPQNKVLTKAEVYCIIRPKLKQYLKKGEKVYEICGDDLCQAKLKPSLSRSLYVQEIKGPKLSPQSIQQMISQMSEQDREARTILQEVISSAKMFYQSFKREKPQRDIDQEYQLERERVKTYRIIPTTVVAQIAGVAFGNQLLGVGTTMTQKKNTSSDSTEPLQEKINQEDNEHDLLANDLRDQMNSEEYLDQHYYPMMTIALQDIDRDNYGMNKRVLSNGPSTGSFECDFIMQALNIVPEDPEVAIVLYKNPNLFQHLAAQGIPIGAQIHVEQSSQQPQQVPQFDKTSKTLPVNVSSASSVFYQLGSQKHKFSSWRPSGRLITTLYEHKNAVNALAITDDSQFFFTGSKLDNMVNIWKTRDIESDVTSHSAFSLKCKRQVNSITTIDNSNYFAIGSSQGCIDIYQMGRIEQEFQHKLSERRQASVNGLRVPNLDKQSSIVILGQQSEPNHTSIVKTIERKDEGDITLCSNMILPIQQQHLLAYVTQRGSLYFHDLRSRYDVSSQFELFGCQRGMATCMTLGQDPYQLYFGTIGGYVMIYDIRYNVVSSYEKHFSRAPINSVAAFSPGRSAFNVNRSDYTSPMMLVSAGSSNYEVSLLNLETSNVEVLLTVDDRKTKDNLAQGLPQVPSYHRETNGYYEATDQKRYETNNSLFRRYLQFNKNSQHFMSMLSLQQQQLIRNLDEEWLKHSKNRYMMVKSSYESTNQCRKVFVPRRYNSMLHNPDTVSYAITGGSDRKIRFWDFTNLKKKSFTVNSPFDDECQYLEEFQGDTLVIQEKVNQFKQFPPITNQLASKQFEALVQPSNNYMPYATSTYYGIVGGLMSQQQNDTSGVYQGLKNSSFQSDRVNDSEVILNFNGLSEWQHFNGVSMNQGCGTVGAGDVSAGGGLDYHYRDSQNVSHSDCILDIGMIELSNQEPILVTCGRDGLVKLWR